MCYICFYKLTENPLGALEEPIVPDLCYFYNIEFNLFEKKIRIFAWINKIIQKFDLIFSIKLMGLPD